MALKKKKDGAEGDDAKKEKKGKGNLLPALIVAVGLIGGGKLMGGGGDTAAATGESSTTTTTVVPGPVVALEPITLNIEGGAILKVGLALQLHADVAEGGAAHGAEPAADDPHKGYARVLDIAIEVFGGRSYQELVASEGREAAKQELIAHLQEAYHDEIEDVYLTEFVMSE